MTAPRWTKDSPEVKAAIADLQGELDRNAEAIGKVLDAIDALPPAYVEAFRGEDGDPQDIDHLDGRYDEEAQR